jgi:tetratricopeptide (TPR) repeat protein
VSCVRNRTPHAAARFGGAFTEPTKVIGSAQNAIPFEVLPDPRTIFVGRGREMGELAGGLNDAFRGRGGTFALSGEPGIGKTRLARQFASLARDRGARVISALTPRGLVHAAPPYWLWIQVVRECLSALAGGEPAAEASGPQSPPGPPSRLPESAEFGELALVLGGRPWLAVGSCGARFRLFDATARLLETVARSRPVVLLLDDLDGADRLSLMGLEVVARELCWMPALIVATYRRAQTRSQEAFREFAGGSAWAASRQLMLDGLGPSEVSRLAQARTGSILGDGTVDSIVRTTRGNPRLVEMVLMHPEFLSPGGYGAQGRARACHALRCAIERHLEPLSDPARRLLAIAAAIGMEFDLAVLLAVAQCAPEQVLDAVGEAEQAGLLEADAALGGRYRFLHPMVRELLHDDLAGAARARLHCRIGEALEAGFPSGEPRLEEIAHHFLEGALTGGAGKALEYSQRAAVRALARLQFKEASRLYAMALAAAGSGLNLERARRCALMVARAGAQRKAGDLGGARESAKSAAELASQTGDFELLAQAALEYAGPLPFVAAPAEADTIALLEQALGRLEDRQPRLRAMLAIRLAAELLSEPSAERHRRDLAREAEMVAERLGDAGLTMAVMRGRHLLLAATPRTVDEQLGSAAQMLAMAPLMVRGADCFAASVCHYTALLRKGGPLKSGVPTVSLGAGGELAEGSLWLRLAERCRAAMRALVEGPFASAEPALADATALAQELGCREAIDLAWPGMIAPFEEADRAGELELLAIRNAEAHDRASLFRAVLARVRLAMGRLERAREDFERLAFDDFRAVAGDGSSVVCAALLAEVCVAIRDERRAASLYELIRPWGETNAVLEPIGFFGPVARHLGRLLALMRRLDEAQSCFDDALALANKTGAVPWMAYTEHDYAAMLLERGGGDDRDRARALADAAAEKAVSLGMRALASRARMLSVRAQAEIAKRAGTPDRAGAPAVVERGGASDDRVACRRDDGSAAAAGQTEFAAPGDGDRVLRREGDYWTVMFDRKVLRLKHCKGLACIAHLLRHPGEEFYAADLCSVARNGCAASAGRAAQVSDGEASARRSADGDLGPMLDATAKAAYKRRLAELREQADQARALDNHQRAADIEREMSFIAHELARAVGLGGRDRMPGSEAERARVRVTNAIRAVLKRIGSDHPALARYLAGTVKTGSFCRFTPDPRFPGEWRA